MSILSKIASNRNFFLNMSASVVIHGILFVIISLFMFLSADHDIQRSQYVQIYTATREQASEEISSKDSEIADTKPEEKVIEEKAEIIPEEEMSTSGFISLTDNKIDTTGLKNIYKEPTLNVTIKYPSGWTFIDQNVKNKLDGVTFWSSAGTYDPPPYIHLEVKEKYLFNPSRYKYKTEMKDYTAYFNDPKELSGQVSQEVYLVTDTDEDYSIKLIMEGKEAFNSFQPVFFGMLKTFKFGRSLF